MKKLLAVLMAITMVFALAACGASEPQPAPAPDNEPSDSTVTQPTEDGAKSLVVYFSWSGNTEKVAKSIQRQTGSDMFEIVPKTPYSTDYNTVVSDAKAEQQENARPEMADAIENMADYDTVYVGFPKMEYSL